MLQVPVAGPPLRPHSGKKNLALLEAPLKVPAHHARQLSADTPELRRDKGKPMTA